MNSRTTLRLILLVAALTAGSTSAFAQTYKSIFPTKITMAGNQSDPINTLTLIADTSTRGPLTWTLPSSNGAVGDVLMTDGTGRLSWSSPMGLTIAGDVTGTPSATVVAAINGVPLGPTTATAGNMLIANGSQWNSKAVGGDATIDTSGNITLANSATTRTHLGLGSIATQNANNVSITGGTITGTPISGSTGSFTDLTVTGTVTLPAGSVTLGSMSLTNSHIIVGNSSNRAADVAMSGDATIINDGTVSVNAVHTAAGSSIATAINSNTSNAINGDNVKHDATLVHSSNNLGLNLANANTWTARQTFGSMALTPASSMALSAGTNDNVDVSATTSNIRFTAGAGAATVTSITNGVSGRLITIVNIDGSNPVTIINEASTGTAANRIHSPNGNLILMPDGTATFIYDTTIQRWRYIDN